MKLDPVGAITLEPLAKLGIIEAGSALLECETASTESIQPLRQLVSLTPRSDERRG